MVVAAVGGSWRVSVTVGCSSVGGGPGQRAPEEGGQGAVAPFKVPAELVAQTCGHLGDLRDVAGGVDRLSPAGGAVAGVDAEEAVDVSEPVAVGGDLLEERHVEQVAQRLVPRAELVDVASPGEVAVRRDRRARGVPGPLVAGELVGQGPLEGAVLETTGGAERPVGDGPLDRVAQLDEDHRVAEHAQQPGDRVGPLEVAGALLAEHPCRPGRVAEPRGVVPLHAPLDDVVVEEHLGLRPRGTGHRDLRVVGQQVVEVRRAAALGADDDQVAGRPAHVRLRPTRFTTW
jgi:hypothetical protein